MPAPGSPSEKPAATRAERRARAVRSASRVPVSSRPVLDPHGLYGTRTAQRRRAVRRRRQFQNALLVLVAIAIIALAFWRWNQARLLSTETAQRVASNRKPSALWQSESALFAATFDGHLLALKRDLPSAQTLFATDFPLRTAPVALDNDLVVAAEDGLVARIAPSGKTVWQWHAASSISTRPLVVRVLDANVSSNATPPKLLIVGDDRGGITALGALDGKPKWTRDLGAPLGNGLSANEDGTRVFAPLLSNVTNRGSLVCLDARNGVVLWTRNLGAACVAAPVAGATEANGAAWRVFAATDNGSVWCFDMQGTRVWKTFVKPLAKVKSDDAVVLRAEPLLKVYGWGARVFVGANDGVLRCLDARDGRELWSFDGGAPLLQRAFAVQIAQNGAPRDAVLIGGGNRLRTLDAKNGALLWSVVTQGEIAVWSARGNTVWSVSRDGLAERFQLP